MNNDMAVCTNKACPMGDKCARKSEAGPRSDRQWMAAFSPQDTPDGPVCDAIIPVAGKEKDTDET